jgi:hypothetical protein
MKGTAKDVKSVAPQLFPPLTADLYAGLRVNSKQADTRSHLNTLAFKVTRGQGVH